MQDLVAKGKEKAGSITYASGGIGAATHLNAERFRLTAGFEAVHVPFKGSPDALREVLGGRIIILPATLGGAADPSKEARRARPL